MKSLTKPNRSKLLSNDAQVQLSLPVAGVLRDLKSAFFGLCIHAGKAVLAAMMESERTALCGPKGVPNVQRSSYRGGHTRSWVVLGGRRIQISRPRARALEAGELCLPSFAWAAQRDPLDEPTSRSSWRWASAASRVFQASRRARLTLACSSSGK